MRQGGRRASGWSLGSGVGWTKGTKGVDTSNLFYCADEVRKAIEDDRDILCVEGEKGVDNLWRIGSRRHLQRARGERTRQAAEVDEGAQRAIARGLDPRPQRQ